MKPLEFEEVNVRIAEHQDEYQTLPACINAEEGSVTFGFELSDDELEEVKATGVIWVKMLTFGRPMQPILLSTKKSDVIEEAARPSQIENEDEGIIYECDTCGVEIDEKEYVMFNCTCEECSMK